MEFITTGNRIAVENFDIGKIYTITWETGNYKSLACTGKGTDFVMFQDQEPDLLFCLTMDSAISVSSIDEGGGGAGTMNYNELENKPSINGFVLVGNKTGAELGLASQSDLEDYATNASVVAGLATKQDALSSSQLQAVNSGITSELVTQIGTNTSAIAGKQDALSSSQLAAVNSGITSALVTQIGTNENNISSVQTQSNWNTNTGVKNLSPYNNGTDDSPIKISCNFKSGERYIISWDSITSTSSSDSSRICFMSGESTVSNIYYATHGISGSTTLTLTANCDSLWIYAGSSYEANKTVTLSNFMIRPVSITDSTYEPYAMSNAELTAAIQALQAQLANQ